MTGWFFFLSTSVRLAIPTTSRRADCQGGNFARGILGINRRKNFPPAHMTDWRKNFSRFLPTLDRRNGLNIINARRREGKERKRPLAADEFKHLVLQIWDYLYHISSGRYSTRENEHMRNTKGLYKHLTFTARLQIEAGLKMKMPVKQIAVNSADMYAHFCRDWLDGHFHF